MNTSAFLADHKRHFDGSYEQFKLFGGPCVYFHLECLRAGRERFLSDRHLEMLYATLTAWGLHRMGGTAKLTDWKTFRDSLSTQADTLRQFLGLSMLRMSESDYSDVVRRLRCCYESLDLSKANATVVVNSKAFHHLFPELIPPIDRQYTIRFFTQVPNKWRDEKRKFRQVPLPADLDDQFNLFHTTCVKIKRMVDQVDPQLFEAERHKNDVAAPKAIDNAIVNFVRRWGKDC